MNNTVKTIFLLGVLSVIVIFVGGFIGGRGGVTTAFFIALLMNGVGYFFSDKIALSSNGAKAVTREESPELYAMVEDLAKRANIPMPGLYITPEMQANAFATGRDPQHASVAVTQGILRSMPPDELKAVLAHELGHVVNRDILISSIAAVLASTVGFLANMAMFSGYSRDSESRGGSLVAAIVAPLMATIVQLAVSRSREFEADAYSKRLLGSGTPLANALRTIEGSVAHVPAQDINPGYAPLYIANPFGNLGSLGNLFSTHPSTEERIKRLLER
jgi:heat shock protein HtpX